MTSRNGGGVYSAAGMDELIGAVRSAGAPNIVVANGVMWGNALDGWLGYAPTDPLGNVVAGVENLSYGQNCHDLGCYDAVLGRLAAAVPLYAAAVTPDTTAPPGAPCPLGSATGSGPSAQLLDWLDHHGAGYAAWSWNAWNDCHALITDDRGTPTPVWGREVQAQLAAAGGP
jgi:hypothetical protein